MPYIYEIENLRDEEHAKRFELVVGGGDRKFQVREGKNTPAAIERSKLCYNHDLLESENLFFRI